QACSQRPQDREAHTPLFSIPQFRQILTIVLRLAANTSQLGWVDSCPFLSIYRKNSWPAPSSYSPPDYHLPYARLGLLLPSPFCIPFASLRSSRPTHPVRGQANCALSPSASLSCFACPRPLLKSKR